MIKKFKEFNESLTNSVNNVTEEDIEDQFLRLKEVFGCELKIQFFSINMCQIYIRINNTVMPFKGKSVTVTTDPGTLGTVNILGKNNPVNVDIAEELNTIKRRIKNQYGLDIIFIKLSNTRIFVWLYSKKDAEAIKQIDNIKKEVIYLVSDVIK